MNREDKIARARTYAAGLAVAHPSISAVILGGSLARGDDLPISDIDLLYFVPDRRPGAAHCQTRGRRRLYRHREPARPSCWPIPMHCATPTGCGYLADARVLYDRDGAASSLPARGYRRRAPPASIAPSSFRRSARSSSATWLSCGAARTLLPSAEVCRASIYALWTLIDLAWSGSASPRVALAGWIACVLAFLTLAHKTCGARVRRSRRL